MLTLVVRDVSQFPCEVLKMNWDETSDTCTLRGFPVIPDGCVPTELQFRGQAFRDAFSLFTGREFTESGRLDKARIVGEEKVRDALARVKDHYEKSLSSGTSVLNAIMYGGKGAKEHSV